MGSSEVAASAAIDAVIFNYGGVLTTPGRTAIQAWVREERIVPESFSAVLKEWLSRRAPRGTPIHRLETGELTAEEFNVLLADKLSTEDGRPVEPAGLLQRLFSHMRRNPGMHELVRQLRSCGIRTALLSNSWGNNYPWDELDDLFEFAVISAEVGMRKPDPDIYQLALQRLGIPPQRTVFVDDGRPNTEAAQHLGMHAILHTDNDTTRQQLGRLIPRLMNTGRAQAVPPQAKECG